MLYALWIFSKRFAGWAVAWFFFLLPLQFLAVTGLIRTPFFKPVYLPYVESQADIPGFSFSVFIEMLSAIISYWGPLLESIMLGVAMVIALGVIVRPFGVCFQLMEHERFRRALNITIGLKIFFSVFFVIAMLVMLSFDTLVLWSFAELLTLPDKIIAYASLAATSYLDGLPNVAYPVLLRPVPATFFGVLLAIGMSVYLLTLSYIVYLWMWMAQKLRRSKGD